MSKNLNIWFFISLTVSLFVLIPILTVFQVFWKYSNYYELLKKLFVRIYFYSLLLLISVVFNFYNRYRNGLLVSFYEFPLSNFLNGIDSFICRPPYICIFFNSFFENYGTAFTISKIFWDGNHNKHIPKFDGLWCNIIYFFVAYVYILTRVFFYISHKINLI